MFLNFAAALATLGEGAVFRVANQVRPAGDYLWATLLPERNRPTYYVESGNMTVRGTMAGLVGMDSPYPPGGMVEVSTFLERTAKLANEVALSEQALRHLQDLLMRMGGQAAASPETLAREALNFLDKVIIQPHLDAMEWMRGQALQYGAINWTFNQKNLMVDYGVPAGNHLPARTIAGGGAYHLPGSVFWSDVQALRRILRGNVRAIIAHPDTVDAVRFNPAHAAAVVAEGEGFITLQRFIRDDAGSVLSGALSQDNSDRVTLVSYGREGEILNPADTSTTLVVPFVDRGKLVAVGNNQASGYVVGQGATQDPEDENALGYTHLAPTVEGGGSAGRWADLFVPQDRPWELRGRGVTNGLPVVEAPGKVATATTEMAP